MCVRCHQPKLWPSSRPISKCGSPSWSGLLRTRDGGYSTVNFHHVVCKAVFEHARREGHMFSGDNPFGFQRRKHKAKKRAKYTVDELNILFNSPTFTEREIKPETYGVVSA